MRVVLDWDGTVTEVDTLHLVLERFGDASVFEAMEAELRGRLTLHEVIRREFETVSAPLEEVVAFLLAEAHVRPGFRELVAERRPLVVSSGFHELIEPLLAREGIEVELQANRVTPGPEGWRPVYYDTSVCTVCGEPCKRRSLPAGSIAYVGDGYSDRCAARAADRVFARDALAVWLTEQGVAYEPFEDLHDVRTALAAAR